ncbi:unnamed protein product [Nesidiocoris tenuis]|uniref:Uncharacterized protein n=1 Tax=Nesidiocoris tenuis TaxID=355587 RepID=A0A6H5GD67_9HEMI|nr:unnamed protein product [Nesidiocoris tenuis]
MVHQDCYRSISDAMSRLVEVASALNPINIVSKPRHQGHPHSFSRRSMSVLTRRCRDWSRWRRR